MSNIETERLLDTRYLSLEAPEEINPLAVLP